MPWKTPVLNSLFGCLNEQFSLRRLFGSSVNIGITSTVLLTRVLPSNVPLEPEQ